MVTNEQVDPAQNKLQKIPCPLCGERTYRLIRTVRDRLNANINQADKHLPPTEFSIVACSSCGFLYLNPRPDPQDLAQYYQVREYDPHSRSGGGLTGFLFRFCRPFSIRWKISRVASGESPGSLLDIGCGTGEFMVEMKRAGWQVTGVEKDEKAAQVARSAGCKVIVDNPAEVDLPPSSFNLVTCWHSLEHLPDLSATVAKIAALIMPEGLLAVAVPNPASLDARFYGSRWAAWDAPRHLYHFRPGDLRKLLEPKGFRCIKSCSLPLDPFYHVLLSELRGASGGGAWLRVVRGLIIGFLSFIAGLKPERGSSTLYLFRKI